MERKHTFNIIQILFLYQLPQIIRKMIGEREIKEKKDSHKGEKERTKMIRITNIETIIEMIDTRRNKNLERSKLELETSQEVTGACVEEKIQKT